MQFLRSRRSIRSFKDQPVEREKLRRLIEILRYAPTGGNRQPVEWAVFTDPGMIKGIADRTVAWMRKVLEEAPQSVPVHFPMILDNIVLRFFNPTQLVGNCDCDATIGTNA